MADNLTTVASVLAIGGGLYSLRASIKLIRKAFRNQ